MKSKATETDKEQQLRMTTQPIPGLVINLAIPTIISMLVTAIYNTADTFFVSQLGTSASGAVGIVFSIMALFQAIGFTFGTGAASIISRKLGANDINTASRLASTAFYLSLLSGLIFAIWGLLCLNTFMLKLGATPTILPYAKNYAKYILLGAPIMCASYTLNSLLRAEGKPTLAMIGLIFGAVLNIILDPILIFKYDLGISGAAIATLISQSISFLILVAFFVFRKSSLKIRIKDVSQIPREHTDILLLGAPSLFRQGLAAIAAVALNVAASTYGDAAIAAMSIVARTFMFVLFIIVGLGQGFMPVVGYNYGAKNYARVKEAFWFTVKVGLIISATLALVGYIFAPDIIASFRKEDADVIAIGTFAMRMQFLVLILQPLFVTANMLFQSTGHAIKATFLSSNRQGLYFLPLIFILSRLFGIRGIEIAQPIADILSFLTCIPFLYFFMRDLNELKVKK